MERWEQIRTLMEAKRRGMEAHSRYLNERHSYAPGTELYMREIHFIMAVGLEDAPTMSELSGRLDVTHGAVSQMATRLEKKGLIQRIKDARDRRQTIVLLTAQGRALYQQHSEYDKKNYQLIGEKLGEFDEEQLQLLIRYETMLCQLFEQINREPDQVTL